MSDSLRKEMLAGPQPGAYIPFPLQTNVGRSPPTGGRIDRLHGCQSLYKQTGDWSA